MHPFSPSVLASDSDFDGLALCQVVDVKTGLAPEWIQLVPAGDKVEALDGRKFGNASPQHVVDAFWKDPRDVPIDWEHASELRAPKGKDAPAAGWIVAMEVRNGAVWGRVEWTQRGRASLESREYRYISPAFMFDKKTGNILRVVSAALVNRPALDMPAVARATTSNDNETNQGNAQSEETMEPKLLELLGLAADATPEQAIKAVETLKASPNDNLAKVTAELETARAKLQTTEQELANARAANPELDKFVPRADYDAAIARAKAAEDKNSATEKAAHDAAIQSEIDAALKAGKITPASKDFYVGTCATKEGLEKFREFVKNAPAIGDASNLDIKPPPDAGTAKATAAELEVAKRCGISEEQFLAAKQPD
jgi:phage I-like protein